MPPADTPTGPPWRLLRRASMHELRDNLGDCKLCPDLCETRRNIVWGSGDPDAPVVFVGEAPGAEEDAWGYPFIGMAGKLLEKALESAGWSRETVYIMNILKCRPPENRHPKGSEIKNCYPWAVLQLNILAAHVIVPLGNVAAKTLLEVDTGITRLRGKWTRALGRDVLPMFHPAFLLRQPSAKQYFWEDLMELNKRLREAYEIKPPFPAKPA